MDGSHIGALPLELLEMICEESLGGDFLKVSLAPRSVCKEMSGIADRVLKRMYKTAVLEGQNDRTNVKTALDVLQFQDVVRRFNAMQPHLKSTRLTFELQHDCSIVAGTTSSLPALGDVEFTRDTRNLVRALSPCTLVLSVNITFHSVGALPSTRSNHGEASGRIWEICSRDAPMTSRDCEQMLVKFLAHDKNAAQSAVDDTFAKRYGQFNAHREHKNHKMCGVRTSRMNGAIQSLANAQDMINHMVSLL
jgi:hypothetical protein